MLARHADAAALLMPPRDDSDSAAPCHMMRRDARYAAWFLALRCYAFIRCRHATLRAFR